jgi:hypothetical protein
MHSTVPLSSRAVQNLTTGGVVADQRAVSPASVLGRRPTVLVGVAPHRWCTARGWRPWSADLGLGRVAPPAHRRYWGSTTAPSWTCRSPSLRRWGGSGTRRLNVADRHSGHGLDLPDQYLCLVQLRGVEDLTLLGGLLEPLHQGL